MPLLKAWFGCSWTRGEFFSLFLCFSVFFISFFFFIYSVTCLVIYTYIYSVIFFIDFLTWFIFIYNYLLIDLFICIFWNVVKFWNAVKFLISEVYCQLVFKSNPFIFRTEIKVRSEQLNTEPCSWQRSNLTGGDAKDCYLRKRIWIRRGNSRK